jgi:hypothetical protein
MVAVEVEGMQREQRIRKRPRPTWDVAPSEPQVRPSLACCFSLELGFWERESASNQRLGFFFFLFYEGFGIVGETSSGCE